jgi:predicted permease
MFSQLNSEGTWMLEDRKTRMFRVLGRLAPAARIPQARAELQSIASALAEAYPDTSKGMSANVLPVWQAHNGLHDSLREPLGMLSGVALVVLLIVCANMASLLLARATDRRRELSLRHALGAARPRLVRQLLTEAAFLAVAGAALGLLVAISLSGTLRFLVPMTTMTLVTPRADWGVLAFTVALAVAVTLLAGIAPALAGAREDANDSLKEGGRSGSASAGRQRLRATLVAAEMALALTAIVAAGLFLKSFRQLARVEPGFDPEKVALGQFSMAASGFDAAQADAFCRRLRERLEEQPSVVAVSYADYVPLSIGAGSWEDLQVEGYLPGPSENMKIYRSIVAPGYFELMKIPLLAGRDFDLNDDSAHAPAMIVNQEFVRRFFGGQYAIGRKVHGWGRWFQVVGVVRDSKVYRLGDRPKAYFYIPLRQVYRPEFALTFYVRTSGSTDEAVASLRRLAGESRAAPPLFNTRTLSESIGASLFRDRTAAMLLSLLAAIAFLLAAIGLYGVMAYSVAQRTGEIGIRVALGARPGDVVRLVLRQAARVLAAGLAAGLLGGALLGRGVAAMLFSVRPDDPSVYAAAAGCAALIALAATIVPAARALRVDPIRALRCE